MDLLTKICPVAFDENAQCPAFLAFIIRIMGGLMPLIEYLQRVFGYALTGVIIEKVCSASSAKVTPGRLLFWSSSATSLATTPPRS